MGQRGVESLVQWFILTLLDHHTSFRLSLININDIFDGRSTKAIKMDWVGFDICSLISAISNNYTN